MACDYRWTAAAAYCCYKYMYKYVGPVVSAIESPDVDQVFSRFRDNTS